MGRQINFFMMPEDVAELDEQVREMGFLMVADKMPTSEILYLNSLNSKECHDKFLFLEQEKPVIHTKFIEEQNFYWIHPMENPVIEFSPCHLSEDGNTLIEGRFFYEIEYFNNKEQLLTCSDEFLKKAEKLFRSYKKRFKKYRIKRYYIGDSAWNWAQEQDKQLSTSFGLVLPIPELLEV
jgi:hypothetical protein